MESVLLIILSILIVMCVCLTAISVYLIIKFKEYKKNNEQIWSKFNSETLEKDIASLIERLEQVEKNSNETKILSEATEGKMAKCIQKVGMIKYDAYNSGNSGLSFAIALLDSQDTGVIINSIYTRNGSNIYAKEIVNKECSGDLTEEEKNALNEALKHKSFM